MKQLVFRAVPGGIELSVPEHGTLVRVDRDGVAIFIRKCPPTLPPAREVIQTHGETLSDNVIAFPARRVA